MESLTTTLLGTASFVPLLSEEVYFGQSTARKYRICMKVKDRLLKWTSQALQQLYVWDCEYVRKKPVFHDYKKAGIAKECGTFEKFECRANCKFGINEEQEPYNHFVCSKHAHSDQLECCACNIRNCYKHAINCYPLEYHQKFHLPGCTVIKKRIVNKPIFPACQVDTLIHCVCDGHSQQHPKMCCICAYKMREFEELRECDGVMSCPEFPYKMLPRLLKFYKFENLELTEKGVRVLKNSIRQAGCQGLRLCKARRFCASTADDHYVCKKHDGYEICCYCAFSDSDWECYGKLNEIDPTADCTATNTFHARCQSHRKLDHCCTCMPMVCAQGQVTSTHSGNKDFIAGSGATQTINYVNYYGAEYSAAGANPTQNLDPAAFTDPVTDLASSALKPDLMSPSAEACGYSDRLLMLTAGNSCMITQESAAGAVVAYGRAPSYSTNEGNHVDLPTRPGVSCDRFYTLDSLYWNKTGIGSTSGDTGNKSRAKLNLNWCLQDYGVFGQNCSYHYLMRCGWVIHVQVNATKFHQGCLFVCAIPEDMNWNKGDNGEIKPQDPSTNRGNWQLQDIGFEDGEWHQWPIYPHQMINLRTNNSATIVLPYVNVSPACLSNIHCPWSLNLLVIASLDYSAGAATQIPITVSIAPQYSEFAGLRGSVSAQGLPVFEIPGSNQFVSTLRNDGYPIYSCWQSTHSFVNPGRFHNLLEVAEIGTFCHFGSAAGSGNNNLCMSVSNTATASKIFSLDISLSADYLSTTYIGRLAQMYQQYRGSLKYTFTYCGTAMTTGKLLLAYTPPGGTEPSTREEAMLGTHLVWDIGLQSSVSFTVPFVSVTQYRMNSGENTAISVCGWISCWYQTSFVYPPDAPATSEIFCLVSACEDFVFRLPMDTAYFQGPVNPIHDAVQSLIHEKIGLSAPATVLNPAASIDQVTTSAPSEISTAVPALTATETGKTQPDLGNTMAIEPSKTTFSRQDTDIEYLLSRYHYVASFNMFEESGTTVTPSIVTLPISFEMLGNGTNLARTLICLATYFRCALDFVFVPVMGGKIWDLSDAVVQYMFVPSGSPIPESVESGWATSLNPVVTFRVRDCFSCVRVPFLSVANYYTTFFNGYGTFAQGEYGTNPCNNVGSFVFRTLNNAFGMDGGLSFQVWVRPVFVECYIPRPLIPFGNPSASRSSVSRRRYVVGTGDKINNPIIRAEKQGPTQPEFQGVMDKLRKAMNDAAGEMGSNMGAKISSNLISGFEKTILAFEPEDDNHWMIDVCEWIVKLICAVTIVVRGSHDPAIVASVGVMLGVDIINSDPFEYLKRKICGHIGLKWKEMKRAQCLQQDIERDLGVPKAKKQGPEWMRDLNVALNIGKGFEWLFHKVKELIGWITDQIKKLRHVETLADTLKFHLAEWGNYQKDPSKFTRGSVNKLCETLLSLKEECEKEEVPKFLFQQLVRIEVELRRELNKGRFRSFEPVGLVIRGTPGQGKSLLTGVIGKALSKFYKVSEPYSLPPDPKYFDGYKGQMVCIMDDLGQNPDGSDFQYLCQMVSTVDFYPPMANVDEKGSPFISDFVLASTNLLNFNPPTISDISAVNRRFFLDLKIIVNRDYLLSNGKLNVAKALEKCEHDDDIGACYTTYCCPLMCGRAVKLEDRSRNTFSVNDVIGMLISEAERKRKVGVSVDGLFQGVCDKRPSPILEKVSVQNGCVIPENIADALMSVCKNEEVIEKLEQEGFIVPVRVQDRLVERQVSRWRAILKASVIGLGVLSAVCGFAYAFHHFFHKQGPYEGAAKQPLKPPEIRQINVQGGGSPNPDFQFAQKIMAKSTFQIQTGSGKFTAVGLYDRVVILPKHACVRPYKLGEVELEPEDEWELVLDKGRNLELVCVKFKNLNQVPDVRKFLPSKIDSYKDVLLVLNSSDFQAIVPVGRVTPISAICLSGEVTNRQLVYKYPTKAGWCGGLLVKAGQVIGLHVGGDGSNGYASALLRGYFVESQGNIVKEEKAVWEGKPVFVNMPKKTQLLPSVYHDIVPGTKEPAVLSDRDPRFNGDLKKQVLAKYKGNVFPHELIRKGVVGTNLQELITAVDHYAEQLKPILPEDVCEKLTLDQAIEGYKSLQKLDLATSAGFPYNTMGITKKQLLADNKKLLLEGLDLHGYGLPFTCYLKDELRTKEKVLTGNTRVIEASSINDSLHTRQIFGRLYAALCANPGTVSGMAVGCNPDVDWTKFHTELASSYVISFDYKNYDASLSPLWFAALNDLLCKLGFDSDDVEFVVDHMCNSVHLYKDTFVHIEGGMPSGCSGTSIFNSMINNIIMKTIVPIAYKGIDLDALKIIAYGDDLLVGYPFPLNGEPIAQVAKLFGLTITPADKGDTFLDGSTIENHTFLKRGFKPDDEHSWLIHPLMDKQAIYESLRWTRNPQDFPDHVRCLCELMWHHGKEEYEEFVKVLRKHYLSRTFNIPPYSFLRRKWLDLF
nr:polyprotein [Guinea fowl picornavirus]